MNLGTILFLLLVLACPLMMFWMMRGGHGQHGAHGSADRAGGGCHGAGHGGANDGQSEPELDDLRTRRAELDRLIEEREASERYSVGERAGTSV